MCLGVFPSTTVLRKSQKLQHGKFKGDPELSSGNMLELDSSGTGELRMRREVGCERGRSECPSRAVESKASDIDVYHTKCENSRDSNIKDSRIGLMRVICRCSLRDHSLFQNLTGSCRFFSPTLLRSDIVSRHTQATASSAFTAIVLQRQSCKFYHNAHSNSY